MLKTMAFALGVVGLCVACSSGELRHPAAATSDPVQDRQKEDRSADAIQFFKDQKKDAGSPVAKDYSEGLKSLQEEITPSSAVTTNDSANDIQALQLSEYSDFPYLIQTCNSHDTEIRQGHISVDYLVIERTSISHAHAPRYFTPVSAVILRRNSGTHFISDCKNPEAEAKVISLPVTWEFIRSVKDMSGVKGMISF